MLVVWVLVIVLGLVMYVSEKYGVLDLVGGVLYIILILAIFKMFLK
ncbi:MAG: hypothetical protein ACRCZ0_08695 [Cetobacterium sp.]